MAKARDKAITAHAHREKNDEVDMPYAEDFWVTSEYWMEVRSSTVDALKRYIHYSTPTAISPSRSSPKTVAKKENIIELTYLFL